MLDKYGIERNYEEKGITGYKGYENLHVNLCNLDYEKNRCNSKHYKRNF